MNNRAIQILRSTSDGLASSKQELALEEGQPFYNSQKNYLTIGKYGNTGKVSDQPITVRKLEGWFDDNEKITASKTDANYYTIYPSDEGRHLYIKNNGNHIYIEANKNIQLDAGEYLNLGTTNTECVKSCSNTEIRFDVSNGSNTQSYLKLTNSQNAELSAPVKITIDTVDLDIGSAARNSDVDITGTLDVTGATTLSSTLGVTGNTTLGGTLTVTGHTDLDNSVTIDGATTIDSTLTTNNLIVKNGANENGINLNLTHASSDVDRPIWMSAAFGTPAAVANGHPAYSTATDFNYNPFSKKLTVNNATIQNGLTITAGGVNVTAGGITVNAGGVTINNGGILAVTAGGATINKKLTVQSEGADITGNLKIINGSITLTDGTNSICLSRTTDNNFNLNSNLNVNDINCQDITSSGNISAEGEITATSFDISSDKRLKKNIKQYTSLNSILNLPIYEFDYISTNKHTIGCLAQDLQEICPEIVSEDERGYLRIEESKLVYLLLQELKRLNELVLNKL